MLKFLRKYNKFILVVAGSALMVLFLLPQAVQSFGPNPLNDVAFRIRDRAYLGKDMQAAQARLGAMQALEQTAGIPFFGFRFESLDHWVLLVHEARAHGLIASGDRAEDLLATLADVRAQQFRAFGGTPEMAAQLEAEQRAATYDLLVATLDEQRARIGADAVTQAVAEIYGVRRLLELFGGFATISTPEAAMVAVRAMDTALVDMAFVDYTETIAEVGEPTTDELAAHFELFKDIDPATSPGNIGYRLPDAVTLEVVEIDLAQIRAAVPLDEIEVNKRWRQNRTTYGEDFAAARGLVESDIMDERLATIVRAIEEVGRRELFREAKDVPVENGFRTLPADWDTRMVRFERLAELINAEIAKSVTVETPAAKVTQIFGWSTAQDIAQRSMGRAFMTIRGQSVSLPGLALSVRELMPDTWTGMQVGVAFGPLTTPRERMVFARVVDARPAGPPSSVDEVRIRAGEDWKKLRAQERLAERVEEIRQTVIAGGTIESLLSVYQRPMMQMGVEVVRSGATLPGNAPATVANSQTMRDAIMDAVALWDPAETVGTRPIADRVIAVPLPDSFGVGVALVKGRYPVTSEAMRRSIAPLSQQYAMELYTTELTDPPFTFERLKQRLGYSVPVSRESETDEAEQDPDAAASDGT
jgi:hypothetical protein